MSDGGAFAFQCYSWVEPSVERVWNSFEERDVFYSKLARNNVSSTRGYELLEFFQGQSEG